MANNIEQLSDVKAEAGVVATLVHHPSFILTSDYLKPGYFFHKENGCIYWAIQELYKSGVDNVDAFNINNMLESNQSIKNYMKKVNMPDMEEFMELSAEVARHSEAEYRLLAEQVTTLSFKRSLVQLLDSMKIRTFNDDLNLNELSKYVYDSLENLTSKYMFNNDVLLFGDKVDDIYDEVKNRRGENGLFGIPSKFPHLTHYFSYESGELVMVSGRMKMGKSAFMLNEAIDKMKKGIPTVYFDTEMNDRLFYIRMLANLTNIPQKQIKSGDLLPEEQKIIDETNEWIKKQPFVHMFIPTATNEELYQVCRILKYKMGLQFVVYDYFKSAESDSSKQYNDLGAKCDFLKNRIAGELYLAVLAGAQLNRNGDVADSDKLERYASVSMNWRKKTADEITNDGKECGTYAANIKLNRLGEGMFEDEYLDFDFAGSRMRIEESKKQHTDLDDY